MIHQSKHPAQDYVTFSFAHNPSAWIGIGLCIFLLILWASQQPGITLYQRKREWEDS